MDLLQWLNATHPDGRPRCLACEELQATVNTLGIECEALNAELAALRAAHPLEPVAGYMVLRTPPHLGHLRGHHRTDWRELMQRLGLKAQHSRDGWDIRVYPGGHSAGAEWTAVGLHLP